MVLTQQALLDMLDRLFPVHWMEPLKSPGPGYEILQAAAKIGERASTAAQRLDDGLQLLTALGGGYADAAVEFSRQGLDACTLKAGSIVKASGSGRQFVLIADVVWAAADQATKAATVRAVLPGWSYNVKGPSTSLDGIAIPGEIDTVSKAYEEPAYADSTVAVRQTADAVGGAFPMLDMLGSDRGMPRLTGEHDAAYRQRIRKLDEVVTPKAIVDFVAQLFAQYAEVASFIETFDPAYQTCYDCPPSSTALDPNLFTYDDPRDPVPFRNRWLDETETRGAFVVVVPRMQPITDWGMCYDDTAMNAAAFLSPLVPGGHRALTAYDAPQTLDVALSPGAYDGVDTGAEGVYNGAWSALQSRKAAGVAALLEREGE